MSDPSIPALAEGRWFWRRLYVFVSTLVFWSLLTWSVSRTAAEHMAQVARGLMWLLGLVIVVYLIAPSAQQIVAILADLRLRLGAGGRP